MLQKLLGACGALLITISALASDTLTINLLKPAYRQGDTISFDCTVPDFARDSIVGTLDVIIENLDKTMRCKYRYPILHGQASADLRVSDLVPDGRYAINFVVRKGFFHLEGKVRDYKPKHTP